MTADDELAAAIFTGLSSVDQMNGVDEPAHLTDAGYEIANAIRYAARHLGTNNAATDMGALEVLSKEIKEGCELVAGALSELAAAIRDSSL